MFDLECPWCEAGLALDTSDEAQEQTCPECQTSWTFAAVPAAEVELPLAA